jgi:hypothetical protein
MKLNSKGGIIVICTMWLATVYACIFGTLHWSKSHNETSADPLVYSEGQYQSDLRIEVDASSRQYFREGVEFGVLLKRLYPNWSSDLIADQARQMANERHGGHDEILDQPFQ